MSTGPTIFTENLPQGYLIVADEQDGRFYPQREALCGGGHRFSTRRNLDGGSSCCYVPISFPEIAQASALIALDAICPRRCEWGSIVYQAEELPRPVAIILHQGTIALEDMTDQGMLYPGFTHGHLPSAQEIHYDLLEVPVEQEPEGRNTIYFLIRDSWPQEPKEITVDGRAKTVLELDGYCFVFSLGEAVAEGVQVREQLAKE